MVINSNKIIILLAIYSILIAGLYIINNKIIFCNNLTENQEEMDVFIPKANDPELPDKVYTFLAPEGHLEFDNLYLETDYMYYIWIELVSEHNVTNFKIQIEDPDDKIYNIFEEEMFYAPEFGRYFEIPFGTAKSGGYDIEFNSTSIYNFNLYVRIEQGLRCLYDKVDNYENRVDRDVERFYNGRDIDPDMDLETDTNYKFYIGRVSAISILENNEVRIDCSLIDPEGVNFIIYNNEPLADISSLNIFNFGTATEGEYELKIKIYCNVDYVNIGYIVIKDKQISEVEDVNKTTSSHKSSEDDFDEKLSEALSNLPFEWIIGTFVFIGSISGASILGLVKHKKKNAVSLNFKKK